MVYSGGTFYLKLSTPPLLRLLNQIVPIHYRLNRSWALISVETGRALSPSAQKNSSCEWSKLNKIQDPSTSTFTLRIWYAGLFAKPCVRYLDWLQGWNLALLMSPVRRDCSHWTYIPCSDDEFRMKWWTSHSRYSWAYVDILLASCQLKGPPFRGTPKSKSPLLWDA